MRNGLGKQVPPEAVLSQRNAHRASRNYACCALAAAMSARESSVPRHSAMICL